MKLNLNVHNNHYSLITNMDRYASRFVCQRCDGVYTRNSTLKNHTCVVADDAKFHFPGGVFRPPSNVFDKIKERAGLDVLEKWPHLAIYPYRITYDIESYFPRGEPVPLPTESTSYTATHRLLSVSLCSNVPGFTDPVCYVREPETGDCPTTIDELSDDEEEFAMPYIEEADDEDGDDEEEEEDAEPEDLWMDAQDDANSGGA